MDGDLKGYYITYDKLDCQLWAIGALLQQHTVRRERVLLPGAVRLKSAPRAEAAGLRATRFR